jgi:hypothetical protein
MELAEISAGNYLNIYDKIFKKALTGSKVSNS